MKDHECIDVALGNLHSLVLTSSRDVYVFGCGENNQLGLGDKKSRSFPEVLPLPLPTMAKSVVACGDSSGVVLWEKRLKPQVWLAFIALSLTNRKYRIIYDLSSKSLPQQLNENSRFILHHGIATVPEGLYL